MKTSWLITLLCLTALRNAQAQAPVAEFTANSVSGCATHVVRFTDQSTGNPKFWNWDFGNGQFSNLQNPTISYSTPGNYTVKLVVRNDDGTHGITKTNYISVYASPQARFTANSTIGCLPSTIRFTDQSNPVSGNIVKWEWDFGDGTTSNVQHPQHTYNAEGYYTVSLRVISSTGCDAARSVGRYIRVVAGVQADFSAAAPATCSAPFNIPFTNLSSGPGDITYQWDFGNGSTSPAFEPSTTYAAAGTYQVTLNARSEYGCTGSKTIPVTISGITTDFTPPAAFCLDKPAVFTNNSSATPISTQWDFGNGETSDQLNGTATFTTPGTYSVLLVNTYASCIDSVRKNVVVPASPPVNFDANVRLACEAPFTVNFRDASPNAASWLWDFGDGTTSTDQHPGHTYTAEGRYTVSLTITTTQGCTNTLTKPTYIRVLKPAVNISGLPAGGCVPYTFRPRPNVYAVDGVRSYLWNFGNGSTSTAENPSTVYTTPGSYTVQLQITTNDGCVASISIPDAVKAGTRPVANFDILNPDVCAATAVSFQDRSTHPDGVDEWSWDFGDGETSSAQNPRHTYRDTGEFSVKLTAFNNRCGATSAAKTVHIKPPVASFFFRVDCTNKLRATFTSDSKVDRSDPVQFSWDFGDGSTSTTENPVHTYSSYGVYTVQLTVTNKGCTQTYSREVRLVNERANFQVTPTTVCRDQKFTIKALVNDPANIRNYLWTLDGGTQFDSTQSFDTSFSTTGTHSIRLIMVDANGCRTTDGPRNAVTVTGPTARFTAATLGDCANNDITFNDASTPAGSIRKWTFDFGDGKPPVDFTAPPFTYKFSDAGRYVVRLTVTDNNNCAHTYELPDTLDITKLQPGFTSNYTTICPKVEVAFKDTTPGNNTGSTFTWDFGDGSTSTQQHPSHIYNGADATYTVKLFIRDPTGCLDSVVKKDYISVKAPKPKFEATDTSTICQLLETSFTFMGEDYESFYWDFGDGSSSTLQDPRHFYNDYGDYTAKLYLIGYGGCLDSASKGVHVYNPFRTTTINYNPRSACNSLTVDFSVATPPLTRFTFSFGDGSTDNSQAKTFQHFYKSPGSYAPSLTLVDSTGCVVPIGGSGRIDVRGAIPLFGMDKKNFCDTGKVYFRNYTQGNEPVVSRTWDFGDGSPTSSEEQPIHVYRQPGTYAVTQTVTTTGNCTNFFRDTVRIYATPAPRIEGKDTVCINTTVQLKGVLAIPDTVTTWTWDPGPGSAPANSPNISVTYPNPGTYTVRLQAANKLGCKKDTSKTIVVTPLPVISVSANPVVIPMGGGIDMPVSYSAGIATYLWSPSTGLNCTECAVPFASPKATTKYNVRITDNNGCSASTDITVQVVCNNINYFVPNTFSPNGDGHNDVFFPRGNFINLIGGLRIFNRWGELIFEKKNFAANDASSGWNGLYKGKPADPDVYIYMIEFICENGAIVSYKGNVTLLR